MKRIISKKIAFDDAYDAFVRYFSTFNDVVIYKSSCFSCTKYICLGCDYNRLHFSQIIISGILDFCKIYDFTFQVSAESSRPVIQLFPLYDL